MSRLFNILLLAGIFSLLGCKEKMPSAEATQLQILQKEVNFKEGASAINISIKANKICTVSSSAAWCKAVVKGRILTVSVSENTEKGVRSAELTVRSEEKSETVSVKQLGWGKKILLSPSSITVPAVGGNYSLTVTANVEYEIKIDNDWISAELATKAHEMADFGHILKFTPNMGSAGRKAVLTVRDKGGDSSLDENISITQNGMDEYSSAGSDALKDDIEIPVTGGEASSYQNGEDLSKSYDGDMNTLYHSAYDNSSPSYFPITLTYDFAEGTDIDYLVYYPRTNSNPNGNFKQTEVLYKLRGGDWVSYCEEDFQGASTASRVDFTPQLKNVEQIRLIVKSGAGDNQGFAACAEMKFYKNNPDKFDPLSLFTDLACTALKPGITDKEINDCKSIFFKNIALFMKNGKYPSEFRIQEYKAYPDPYIKARENKTSPYGYLDNPTGIFAKAGEEIIVLVDGLGQHQASLYLQNLDKPGGDGFYGLSYNLRDGINKITVTEKGLLYILYQDNDYRAAPAIKVHIASGEVNGYFDIRKHSASDWKKMLDGSKCEYFDVMGEYSHLTFPTQRFRDYTSDGEKLIRSFDDIVRAEQEFMGLMKYHRTFPNRMHLIVVYKGHMYATAFYTAYNNTTLPNLCDVSKLTTGECWGPAHEIGHCNQTRPGFKWQGTTEVTNNVMSQYIQTVLFKQPSRLQTEDMKDGTPNRYARAWRDIIAAGASHAEFPNGSDVFCKLVPLWQLQLYFGEVLGRSPEKTSDKSGFYADIYEHIRSNPDLATAGEQQTEFVYICSKVAKLNLLDFFTKWGFLKPIDTIIDDYGKGPMKFDQARADEIIKRVNNLGYPAPDIALEYISDNNKELFKTKPAVIGGTASRNGDDIILNNWKNVVVYEVRDASDKLVFASEGVLTPSSKATFKITSGWKSGYKVYAVSATRQKTEVKL